MRLRVLAFAFAAQFDLACLSAHAQQAAGCAVFNVQCVACHQVDGQGVPGSFPQLAHNPDLFLARDFPARVVLFGMEGTIVANGQTIQGAMPPLGNVLSDEEIAAVVNYVCSSFGNAALAPKATKTMPPLDAATVAALRKLADTDVHAYRETLKGRAKK